MTEAAATRWRDPRGRGAVPARTGQPPRARGRRLRDARSSSTSRRRRSSVATTGSCSRRGATSARRARSGSTSAVHLADVFQYLLGSEFASVSGRGFIAEPVRRRGDATARPPPRACTPRACRAVRSRSSRRARTRSWRCTDGRAARTPGSPGSRRARAGRTRSGGSTAVPARMEIPGRPEWRRARRSTWPTAASRARSSSRELPDFAFDEATARLFPTPTYADWPFPRVDAAHLALTFWDFGRAIDRRPPGRGRRPCRDDGRGRDRGRLRVGRSGPGGHPRRSCSTARSPASSATSTWPSGWPDPSLRFGDLRDPDVTEASDPAFDEQRRIRPSVARSGPR